MHAGYRRHVAVIVMCIVILLLVIFNLMTVRVFVTDLLSKLPPVVRRQMSSGPLPLFTAAELAYVQYGEGADELVGPRDQRYLQFIRSHVVMPIADKPTLIPNLDQVIDKSVRGIQVIVLMIRFHMHIYANMLYNNIV